MSEDINTITGSKNCLPSRSRLTNIKEKSKWYRMMYKVTLEVSLWLSEWNSRHTLSHCFLLWFTACSKLYWPQMFSLSSENKNICVGEKLTNAWIVRVYQFSQCDSMWWKKSLSLKGHQPRSLRRWNSDCLLWTTEKHCTYSTIQTLQICRQQRGAWWEISTAFKVSKKLKHSSSTTICKIWTVEQRFSWDYSGFRENSDPLWVMNSIVQL